MSMQRTVTKQPSISSEKIITFPNGIPGFEEYTTFNIFHKDDGKVSAYWLESCMAPKVTFTLVDPTVYDVNYEIFLDDKEQEMIKAYSPQDIGVFMMLIKNEGATSGTQIGAYIRGPLVINVREKLGLQKVVRIKSNESNISTP